MKGVQCYELLGGNRSDKSRICPFFIRLQSVSDDEHCIIDIDIGTKHRLVAYVYVSLQDVTIICIL